MGKKIFKSIVLIVNFGFLASTIYLLFVNGRYNPHEWKSVQPMYVSSGDGVEMILKVGIRIISITLLLLSTIYFFDKRKKITLVHIIIIALTLLTTFTS